MSVHSIREILGNRPLHSVAPDTTVPEIARLMAQQNVGAVVVLDGETLKGVLSERDIVRRGVAEGAPLDNTTAAQIMTPDPVTVGIDDAISDALMAHLGDTFRHLPVMDGPRVAGLISYRDIPAEYAMMFERFREMSQARADQAP